VSADPGRLRDGLLLHDPVLELPVGLDCVTAVRDTGRLLVGLGHAVEESAPAALGGPSGVGMALRTISTSNLAARLDAWAE